MQLGKTTDFNLNHCDKFMEPIQKWSDVLVSIWKMRNTAEERKKKSELFEIKYPIELIFYFHVAFSIDAKCPRATFIFDEKKKKKKNKRQI